MPQQVAILTPTEVEALVPVVAAVLVLVFGHLGLLRYPTKPLSMAVQVAAVSICTCLQVSPPMGYENAVRELLSSQVPHAYTTIKKEQQAEETMMGVIRVRTREATVLPKEYGPVNWYNAPADLSGQPFRFRWPTEILRKIINASLVTSLTARSNYSFNFIQILNRYWKEPVGYPREPHCSRARVSGPPAATP